MDNRYRVGWLVVTSLFFYAWGEPKAIICMILMIMLNFIFGFLCAPNNQPECTNKLYNKIIILVGGGKTRKIVFLFGVLGNILTLAIYKYLDFSIANINFVAGTNFSLPGIALPIGISFYCFQCISYLVDVYRGTVPPSRDIKLFALYISFFPALIAGPIVRYIDVYRELQDRLLDVTNCATGIQRFTIGLAKKVLIADPMGAVADAIMSLPPTEINCLWAWGGIVCYSLQIYYDFSSYSDMAIGLAKFFNINIPENFRLPYSAISIKDFWRRWHISLSSWLRDYIYIPLGGSRNGNFVAFRNVWIVFLVCGLWHGASWTFVVWGIWHGLGLSAERLFLARFLDHIPRIVRNLYLWVFVLLGWVWFRSPDFGFAIDYFKALFGFNSASFWLHVSAFQSVTIFSLLSFIAGFLLCYEAPNKFLVRQKDTVAGTICTIVLFVVAWSFALTSNFSPFIYFRF